MREIISGKKKGRRKTGIPWKAIEKAVESKKTKPHVKEAFSKALKYHKEGLTDSEVKKKMNWK